MPSSKKTTKSNWGGVRKARPGKKLGPPVRHSEPEFVKKFRATPVERSEFADLLTGDARQDFLIILEALRQSKKEK